ncbi:hypothetical protein EZS27_040746, partial [termite gut metagenome]
NRCSKASVSSGFSFIYLILRQICGLYATVPYKCDIILFLLLIKNSSIMELALTDATRNDITDAKESLENISPRDLLIRDLGYCSLTTIGGIKHREGFFVFRLMPSLTVFDFKGEEVDFKKICKKMKKYAIPHWEMIVFIGNKERIMTRLWISLACEKAYK